MKNLFLFIGILLAQISFSQKIEETRFDKTDSVYTIKTSTETIGSRILVLSGDIKELKFCTNYHKSVAGKWRNNTAFEAVVYFFFIPDAITSITGGASSVKVKFEDGDVVEHKHEGSNRLVGSNKTAAIYFTVLETDKLFTTPVRSVKVSVSSGELEYEIDNKKKQMIKNSLQLLHKESKNLPLFDMSGS